MFTSYRTGRSDVYTMDPSGANVRHLTTSPNHDGEPAWSWDHKQIAFIRGRWNGTPYPFDVYIINGDGTNGHWARPYAASSWSFREPSWTPDGKLIVVRVEMPGGNFLGWIDLATGAVKFSNPSFQGTMPSYDKAGQRIVYIGNTGKTIEQINADGWATRSGLPPAHPSCTRLSRPTARRSCSSVSCRTSIARFEVRSNGRHPRRREPAGIRCAIGAVLLGGRYLDRVALDALLARAEAAANR